MAKKAAIATVNNIVWYLPPGCTPEIWNLNKTYSITKKEK